MQWLVKLDTHKILLEFDAPFAAEDDRPIICNLKNKKISLRFLSRLQTWSISNFTPLDSNQLVLEKNYHCRRSVTKKASDQVETELYLEIGGCGQRVINLNGTAEVYTPASDARNSGQAATSKVVKSPITGNLLKIIKPTDSSVAKGEAVMVIEAMKMENKIYAPIAGKIIALKVEEKQAVQVGQELFTIQS